MRSESTAIAIVGMGFRLPGADRPEQLWPLLRNGVDLVGEVPASRGDAFHHPEAPRYGAFLDDVAGFDAPFFGLKGLEACTTDPAQRLLLMSAWEAFEDAALDPTRLRGTQTGVFIGAHSDDYHELAVRGGFPINAYWNAGLNGSILANRISYFFDLLGPSLTINTACSSSLEALVWAVDSLRTGRCETALVGAANLVLLPTIGLGAARAGMLSPQGKCRSFDSSADGFVRGEGVVVLVLKPLDAALSEGYRLHGVIRGARSGHGGQATNLAAPNLKRQRDLICATYREAGIDAATVGYLEAHGTGTRLGDSVEVEALKEAFADLLGDRLGQAHCVLGSLKSSMGHLEAAAGLAGLVKLCLAMRHATLPPLVHFRELNPLIDLAGSPFLIEREAAVWLASDGQPRRAGLSGFGFGGSYAHVILEEPPAAVPRAGTSERQLIPLSARDEERLLQVARRLLDWLQTGPDPSAPLAAIAETLRYGRAALNARLAIVCTTREELIEALQAYLAGSPLPHCHQGCARRKNLAPDPASVADLDALARAFVTGAALDETLPSQRHRPVDLPTYPFCLNRYWLEA